MADDACEICGVDHPMDEVEQVRWMNTPGGVIRLCIVCRKNHEGEWRSVPVGW